MSDQKPNIKPPNPFDFGSICQFLDELLSQQEVHEEYRQCIGLAQAIENERLENDGRGKDSLKLSVFETDAFEMAIMKTLWALSGYLVEFKSKPQKEQDIKREFLAKENLGSLSNALSTGGFPDAFGKIVLKTQHKDIKNFQLSKALLKADRVFHRSFNFVHKDTELVKKKVPEILDKVYRHSEPGDVRLYLDALLYKVEASSTENAFASQKRIITTGIDDHRSDCMAKKKEMEDLDGATDPETTTGQTFLSLQEKISLMDDYLENYFACEDFIFVDKSSISSKKKQEDATEKNNKPVLSEEFVSSIEVKSLIQFIKGMKLTYNSEEWYLLKAHALKDLVKDDPQESENNLSKFQAKKSLLLEALKTVRTDMIVEDVFNTASDLKKKWIETFEKELLRSPVSSLKGDIMMTSEKQSGGVVASAKRVLKRKEERAIEASQEKEVQKEQELGLNENVNQLIVSIFRASQTPGGSFKEALKIIEPQLKDVMNILSNIEEEGDRNTRKTNLKAMLQGLLKKIEAKHSLDPSNYRALSSWIAGVVKRLNF